MFPIRRSKTPNSPLSGSSISAQFLSIRDMISSLNIKTKKREQLLEMINNLEKSVCPEQVNESKELSPEKIRKKKRRLFKSRTCDDGNSNLSLSLRSGLSPVVREDSVQNLHQFLENRAAKLALEEHEQSNNQTVVPQRALETLQKRLMKFPVQLCPSNSTPVACLFGPDDYESEDRYGHIASAQTISTYPQIPEFGRSGDPICDRFYVQLYANTSIIALGDGCNWGDKPREAAILACNEIVTFMSSRLGAYVDTSDIGCLLLKAFMKAHDKILATKEVCYEAGTTTVLAGVLVKLKEPVDSKEWVFVCVSVGDCKAFYYSMKKKSFVDITVGNRMNLTDARDCGGRLGPADAEGLNPDLRNLMSYYALLDENDIVVVVSDGVHDNLDPQLRGINPTAFGIDAEDWNEAEEKYPEQTNSTKCRFLTDSMNETVHKLDEPVTPHLITRALITMAKQVTEPCRSFMENTLGARQPDDYVNYPGKMDHTSCVSIRAQLNTEHPYTNLAEVLKVPEATEQFQQFIENTDLSQVKCWSSLDGEKRNRILRELSLLQDLYLLTSDSTAFSSTNETIELGDPVEFIVDVASLYIKYHSEENHVIFDDAIEKYLAGQFREFVDRLIVSVEKHFHTLFENFKFTKWMKYECFP